MTVPEGVAAQSADGTVRVTVRGGSGVTVNVPLYVAVASYDTPDLSGLSPISVNTSVADAVFDLGTTLAG